MFSQSHDHYIVSQLLPNRAYRGIMMMSAHLVSHLVILDGKYLIDLKF